MNLSKKTYLPTLNEKVVLGNMNSISNAYFLGRWFERKIDGCDCVVTINAGSSFFVRFTGSKLEVVFKVLQTPCVIAVSIDYGPYQWMQAIGKCFVAKNLKHGVHMARIFVDSIKEDDDLWMSGHGLAVEKIIGENTEAVKPRNPIVWFLGDSITAGIHVSGNEEPETNSYVKSYTNVASNILGIVNIPIAFGATGVTTSGSGGVPKASGYLNYDMHQLRDHCQKPELIVLNYGTNDRQNAGLFVEAYKKYLQMLKKKVTDVPIVVVKPFMGALSEEIDQLKRELMNIQVIEAKNWVATYTDDLHPNAEGSKMLGIALAERLSDLFEEMKN